MDVVESANTAQNDSRLKSYQFEISKASTGQYVFAVWSTAGFAHYLTYPGTTHSRRKIRKTLGYFGGKGSLEIPDRIDWQDLPEKDFIDPFTAEAAS